MKAKDFVAALRTHLEKDEIRDELNKASKIISEKHDIPMDEAQRVALLGYAVHYTNSHTEFLINKTRKSGSGGYEPKAGR